PTGLYAEHLAARLQEEGAEVRLVGGRGDYRHLQRAKPIERILHLDHYQGRRGNIAQTFAEYSSVRRAFRNYIARFVRPDDLVIVTSAPPNTVTLARAIRRRGARSIYWLQDYYPELVRGLHEYPLFLRSAFRAYWDRQLAQWDQVVKIGANLGGPAENAIVIRNWPTLSFTKSATPEPRTALYSGNLGYGHDIALLVEACEKLRLAGYRITMRTDGRGSAQLPAWLRASPLLKCPAELRDDLLRHETHLVAANPRITQAIFPSKIWNSLAARRHLIGTGFAGEMLEEFEVCKTAPFAGHLEQWTDLIETLQDSEVAAPQRSLNAVWA
ncbi:MAG: hypothetical protein ABI839_05155, partial [Verrucomicrobiota bacterium]